MLKNYCCSIWFKGLADELIAYKEADLEEKIAKGIDKYVFAQVYDILDNLIEYCPVCGTHKDSKRSQQMDADVHKDVPKPTPKKPTSTGEASGRKLSPLEVQDPDGVIWCKACSPREDGKFVERRPCSYPNPFACHSCRGTGKMGGDPRSKILCIACHGKGKMDNSNVRVARPDVEKRNEELKEQLKNRPQNPDAGKSAKEMDV